MLLAREEFPGELVVGLGDRYTSGGQAVVDGRGVVQFVDSLNRCLVTIFPGMLFGFPGEEGFLEQVERVVGPIPPGMVSWSEILVPFDAPLVAWDLVQELVDGIDGVLVERG